MRHVQEQIWTGRCEDGIERTYNIAAVLRAAARGAFGPPKWSDLTEATIAHLAKRHVYPQVLAALPLQPARLDEPVVTFIDQGRDYIADGVHRLLARHRVGIDFYT